MSEWILDPVELNMTNKDKRSIILSCVIGDGSISEINIYNGKNSSGSINIKHGHKQKDYLEWKTEILSKIKGETINIHSAISYVKALDKSYDQFRACWVSKKFRAWKRIFYKDKTKDVPKILKFIRHINFCAAVWLMDDGTASKTKKKNGTIVFTGLILYICDQPKEACEEILQWWNTNLGVNGKMKWQKQYYKGIVKYYPKIYFSNLDSLKIYEQIRPYVIQIPTMLNKFQAIEDRRNRRDLLQPQTADSTAEDIVHK